MEEFDFQNDLEKEMDFPCVMPENALGATFLRADLPDSATFSRHVSKCQFEEADGTVFGCCG
jgi:hypothetical protein